MNGTGSIEKDCYIKPKKAWRLLKTADDENVTAYIYGVSGTGKSTLITRYLGKRKYKMLHAGTITPEELQIPEGAVRKIIVIDDLHELIWEEDDAIQDAIFRLIVREDVWVILSGRCPVPPWLTTIRFREGFYIIDETMLIMDMQAILKYVEQTQMVLTEAQKQRLSRETGGMAFALCVAMSMYYELGYTNGLTDSEYDEYSRKVIEQMWNYLEFHVYDKWDIRMQEFLMKISIVDTFTVRLAEMITGTNDAENLIEHARWMGNFLDEQMGANGEKIYKLRDHMRLSMQRRMHRKYTKEQIKNVYENAGLFYQLAGDPMQALTMYEKAGSTERMLSILIDNARKSPNSAYFYELKQYYLALPEESVKKSPELMCGMSMLQSLLLNPEESERWYQELQAYADSHQGSSRRIAKNNLLYLEIGLPHRGSVDMVNIMKQAYRLVFDRQATLGELSVTSNQPSMMNGGKDFCEWSKKDRELAGKIGKRVEFVLGKYGKGLVNLALAESFFEKGEDNYEVAVLANKGRMQAEAGGKIEQCFVADGILAWLHIINGKVQEAEEILRSFYEKAEKEGAEKLLPNIQAFLIRCALYKGEWSEVNRWMEQTADENVEFSIYERFLYITKARVYIQRGKYDQAYNLLVKLQYYADVMKRTYIRIECNLLMAVTLYRMGNDDWKVVLQKGLAEAEEYHFVRVISREGAAIYPLLQAFPDDEGKAEEDAELVKTHRQYYRQVMKETENVAKSYPGYLKAGKAEVRLNETGIRIIKLLAEGYSRIQVAEQLDMTEANVKYHMAQAYKKLGVKDKAGAVLEAKNRQLI